MENVDLLTRINQHYNSFSKGQKLLANYIIDNYDRAAFITASKMGRTVGVSESTVVRFAYALGYDGYPALQRSLQEMIRNRLTTVQRIQLTSDLSQDEVLSTVLKSDISNIRSTIESVNTATFNTVIDYMLKARKIYVVGIKSAAPLAQFLGYYLNFILDDVCIVNSTVYETMLRISDKDMCIGISFPRYSSKAVEALSLQLAAKTPNPDRDAEQGLAYPGRAVTEGSIGPDVMQVEQWLNGRANLYCGEDFVTENSSFGPAETVAVKAAQARAGLEQTGIVNRETWAALRAQSCECEEE